VTLDAAFPPSSLMRDWSAACVVPANLPEVATLQPSKAGAGAAFFTAALRAIVDQVLEDGNKA